jgi:hypothetical protein
VDEGGEPVEPAPGDELADESAGEQPEPEA